MTGKTKNKAKNGFFELSTPYDLFCKAKHDLKVFCEKPSSYNLFNLVCVLNHLREWIEKDQSYDRKSKQLCVELNKNQNYKIIKAVCNNAKHFRNISQHYSVFEGFRCGFNRAGDRLGQRNYMVDGQDVRDIVSKVFNEYKTYFESY